VAEHRVGHVDRYLIEGHGLDHDRGVVGVCAQEAAAVTLQYGQTCVVYPSRAADAISAFDGQFAGRYEVQRRFVDQAGTLVVGAGTDMNSAPLPIRFGLIQGILELGNRTDAVGLRRPRGVAEWRKKAQKYPEKRYRHDRTDHRGTPNGWLAIEPTELSAPRGQPAASVPSPHNEKRGREAIKLS